MQIKQYGDLFYGVSAADLLSADTTAEDMAVLVQHFSHCGCLAIEDVFSVEVIDELKVEFDSKYGYLTEEQLDQKNYSVGNKRFHITLELDGKFSSPMIYANPAIMRIMQALLGEDFIMNCFVAVQSLSGSEHQNLHRDIAPLFKEIGEQLHRDLPAYAINLIIPLVDITPQTGTTALWPGSHRRMRRPEESDPVIYATIPRGAVYLWDYRLFHAGLANISDHHRPIISMIYSRAWFVDTRNFDKEPPIYMTRAQYESIPESLKPLFRTMRWVLKDGQDEQLNSISAAHSGGGAAYE